MSHATRQKRIDFVKSFGLGHFEKQLEKAVRLDGLDFLTDEQIERIAEITALDARLTNQINVRNRNHFKRLAQAAE